MESRGRITTAGLYKYVRHPLMMSMFLIMWPNTKMTQVCVFSCATLFPSSSSLFCACGWACGWAWAWISGSGRIVKGEGRVGVCVCVWGGEGGGEGVYLRRYALSLPSRVCVYACVCMCTRDAGPTTSRPRREQTQAYTRKHTQGALLLYVMCTVYIVCAALFFEEPQLYQMHAGTHTTQHTHNHAHQLINTRRARFSCTLCAPCTLCARSCSSRSPNCTTCTRSPTRSTPRP